MVNVNLLVKTSSVHQLRKIEQLLTAEFENLAVEVKVQGNAVGNWVQVSLSGEDEAIATSYVSREIGICPKSIGEVAVSSTFKGYIIKTAKNGDALLVDIGVFEPKSIMAKVSLAYLQEQLMRGRKIPLSEIAKLYGFCEGLPISVRIIGLEDEQGFMQAEFSSDQIERIRLWEEALLDRLIILGSSLDEVEAVVERARLFRDVIGVDSFGLFEHVLTCKLGTDAAGLIPRIGRYLKYARFVVFNPKKILDFIG